MDERVNQLIAERTKTKAAKTQNKVKKALLDKRKR